MIDPNCLFCTKLAALSNLPEGDLVWEFHDSVALLGPWQFYRGYCILVHRQHVRELNHLEDLLRRQYFEEMCLVARAIEDCFQPLKLNYELIGNQVPHLHWHLFPRYADDPDRLRTVWPAIERADKDEEIKARLQADPANRVEIANLLRARLRQLVRSIE